MKETKRIIDNLDWIFTTTKKMEAIDPEDLVLNSIPEAIDLLQKQVPAKPKNTHLEYPKHDWQRDEHTGEIDTFAVAWDYHNGPVCKRCSYSFCIHCDPNGWNKGPCVIDYNECPGCGKRVGHYSFCADCGQELDWGEPEGE